MAPAPRKTTGRAAPSRKGAASAVSAPTGEENIVELDPATPIPADHGNTEVHDASDAPATDIPAPRDEPVTDVDGDDAPAIEVEAEADAEAAALERAATLAPRDLSVLARLADTSGRSAVTPYPGAGGPSPVVVLPPLRHVHDWSGDGDTKATARVLVDGWRTVVNGTPRFAGKGDRVTAPADVIDRGVRRGTVMRENQE